MYVCEWGRLPFEVDTEHGISPRGRHCQRDGREEKSHAVLPPFSLFLGRSIFSGLIQPENRRAFAKEARENELQLTKQGGRVGNWE